MFDFKRPRGRALRRGSVAIGIVTALALGAMGTYAGATETGTTQTASVSHPHGDHDTKPTVVFVHGGWADSSGWSNQIAALIERGYEVFAPANPLRGVASDSQYLSSFLSTLGDREIVLVGHSYGGAVMSNAAVGHDNVKALVFIAGWAVDEGERIVDLVSKYPGTLITPESLEFRPYDEGERGSGTDIYIKKSAFRAAFAADLPRRVTDVMAATQRPFSVEAFEEPSGPVAWKTIPSWYLVGTADKAIPPAMQLFMARRADAHITKVEASHVSFLSQPKVTLRVILKAIWSVD